MAMEEKVQQGLKLDLQELGVRSFWFVDGDAEVIGI